MKLDKLLKLVDQFEKQAQMLVSAQPGDIQTVLEDARLWNIAPTVSPLLTSAGISEDAQVSISLLIGPRNVIDFNVILNPNSPNAAKKLSMLLKQKFGAAMLQALQNAKLNINNQVNMSWLKF